MQVYKGVPVITNKHPIEEREGVVHHVMDHVNWDEDYFIHRYTEEATRAIDEIHSRGKVPIIIGGTNYYLQSLLFRNKTIGEQEEKHNLTTPTEEQQALLDGPPEPIFEELMKLDPVISGKFHPQDKRKLRRALEIYYTTGKRPSDMYRDQKLNELEDSSLKYKSLLFWVYCDPETLIDRLDVRVDQMMETGALPEIEEMNKFYKAQATPPDLTKGLWQVIGFKEFLPWLGSEKQDEKLYAEGVERMKIRTRQYAKYQVKWIKKLLGVELNKEARFNFKYGGKLYLLDSTDLAEWNANVHERGVSVAKQFLENGPLGVTESQAPDHLAEITPSTEFYKTFKSNKNLDSVNNWKHYECPLCKDSSGKPLVAVGEDNWNIHVKSRRHRRQVHRELRQKTHEELIKRYKKGADAEHLPGDELEKKTINSDATKS